jgi:hypothetical protein
MEKLEELLSDSPLSSSRSEDGDCGESKESASETSNHDSKMLGTRQCDKSGQQSSNGHLDLKSAQIKGLSLLEIEPSTKVRVPFSNQSPQCP